MNWVTNLKISKKLMISYLILSLVMVGVGLIGLRALGTMNRNIRALYYDSLLGITYIKDTAHGTEAVSLFLQRMVMPEYRNQIASLENEANRISDKNKKSFIAYGEAITNPQDRAMFEEYQKILANYQETRKNFIDLVKKGNFDEAGNLYKEKLDPITVTALNYLSKMSEWNDNIGKSYIKQAEDNYSAVVTQMIITVGFSLLLAVLAGFFITRSIVKPVNALVGISEQVARGNLAQKIEAKREDEIGQLEKSIKDMVTNLRNVILNVQSSADNVAASSEELTASADQSAQAANNVASSIMDVAQGAEKQLHIVGETVNTAEKMSAEAEQIAANANIVAATSDKTAQSAEDGQKAVEKAINQMASIQKTVENLAREITGLGTRSKEIGQIVETISGIAGQTNLLALNAAIEAARAGEQGRGFAVVAEEVRKLAEQSQEAAKQISSLIGGIQADTNKAVAAMEEGTKEVKVGADLVNSAGVAFEEIVKLIDQTSSQLREISQSIQEMADGSQAIVTGAQEINTVSKETSAQTQSVSAATEEQLASMQEIASASQALSKRAEELQAIAQKFVT